MHLHILHATITYSPISNNMIVTCTLSVIMHVSCIITVYSLTRRYNGSYREDIRPNSTGVIINSTSC